MQLYFVLTVDALVSMGDLFLDIPLYQILQIIKFKILPSLTPLKGVELLERQTSSRGDLRAKVDPKSGSVQVQGTPLTRFTDIKYGNK